jgi:hypothetical protein
MCRRRADDAGIVPASQFRRELSGPAQRETHMREHSWTLTRWIVGEHPVAADAAALLAADDVAAAGLKQVLQRGQTAGTCADHAAPLSAG